MKRLISLTSTKNKTLQQAAQEAWKAFKKYQRVKKRLESQLQKDK